MGVDTDLDLDLGASDASMVLLSMELVLEDDIVEGCGGRIAATICLPCETWCNERWCVVLSATTWTFTLCLNASDFSTAAGEAG